MGASCRSGVRNWHGRLTSPATDHLTPQLNLLPTPPSIIRKAGRIFQPADGQGNAEYNTSMEDGDAIDRESACY